VKLTSKLFLADLGGSEQVKKSKVKGAQMQEAIFINQGLFALGKCVDALNEGHAFVPYQNSKLTMLLSEALGGDCKTTVVVTAGAEDAHALETLQAMRFGERCRKVRNTAEVGASSMTAALEAMEKEILECEEYIRVNERWETRYEERVDERAGLHIVEEESLAQAGELLAELQSRSTDQGLRVVIRCMEAWTEATAAAAKDAEEGSAVSDEQAEASKAAAGKARNELQAAAEELQGQGFEEISQRILDLVVVKVQATGDQEVERKAVTVLVGAEEHRARLESLLRKRRIITGN